MVATGGEGEGLEGESSQRSDGDGPGRDGAATRGRRDGDGPGAATETSAATATGVVTGTGAVTADSRGAGASWVGVQARI